MRRPLFLYFLWIAVVFTFTILILETQRIVWYNERNEFHHVNIKTTVETWDNKNDFF